MTKKNEAFTLLPDYRMTRRKRYHILLDHKRDHVMAAIELAEVLEYVLENNRCSLIIETDEQNYVITINRLPGPSGPPPEHRAEADAVKEAIDADDPPRP